MEGEERYAHPLLDNSAGLQVRKDLHIVGAERVSTERDEDFSSAGRIDRPDDHSRFQLVSNAHELFVHKAPMGPHVPRSHACDGVAQRVSLVGSPANPLAP